MAFRRTDEAVDVDWAKRLLKEILERLPAGCRVTFGPMTAEEKAHIAACEADKAHHFAYYRIRSATVTQEFWEEGMAALICERGVKSGSIVDYRWVK
jgi:hypothetical protein